MYAMQRKFDGGKVFTTAFCEWRHEKRAPIQGYFFYSKHSLEEKLS